LVLSRRPDARAASREFLLTFSPADRAEVLSNLRSSTVEAITEWLYRKWLDEDRHLLADDRGSHSANWQVISATLDRVETRAVLQEMWRESRGVERRKLLDLLSDEQNVRVFPGELSAAEHLELAETLALPTGQLASFWGRSRLLEIFNSRIHAEHVHQSSRPAIRDPEREFGPFSRMLRVMNEWQDPCLDEWIAGRVLSATLHPEVCFWLMDALWRRNRAFAAITLAADLHAGHQAQSRIFLSWAARAPVVSDHALFWEAVRPAHGAEIQYYALCGLERLGESGKEWLGHLRRWSKHPEPRLRIRALGALARQGDHAAHRSLLAWAETPHALRERAEAVAVLGELERAEHVPLFVRMLTREERPKPDSGGAPVAEEAALVLARLATPVALTALLRAFLTAESHYFYAALYRYLDTIANPETAIDPVLRPPECTWRGEIHWRWIEAVT
jgi:hypothetical protein